MTDLTSPGSSVSLATVSGGNAIFSYGVPAGSGTGVYHSFLATQSTDGTAEGFNNDATGNILDTNSAKTESIALSSLQQITQGGVNYYVFRLDLNESPDAVQLNDLKIFTSANPAATADFNNTTDTFTNGTQTYTTVFDLNDTLLLTDHATGSGTDDYQLLIPVDAFSGTSGYVTLYTNFGAPKVGNTVSPNAEDGGFDEWAALTNSGTTSDGDPAIQVVKTASVTEIAEGTPTDITYTYQLTNISSSNTDPLTVTSLNDDVLGNILTLDPTVSGDSNGNGLLDKGETWTYQVTVEDVVANVGEDIVNVVTVKATDDEQVEVSDTDTETVTVTDVDPSIHVVKTASVTEIAEGTATDITYTYELTNTGASTDPLSVTGLDDDKLGDILANGSFLGGDSNGNDLLDVGETWTYEITADDVVLDADETLVNEVTATGVDDEGNEDSDTDTETVTGTDVDPSIHVVKTASVTEIAEGTATDITYTYELTNTGASTDPLSVTGLSDDKLGDILTLGQFTGGDTNGNDLLDVGETWTYEITADDVVLDADETLVNEVTATGVDDEGNEDSDTDTETVTGTDVDPSIHVVKTASVTEIAEGTATDITYTYELTNTGASTDPLSVTGLDDDKLGDILANGSFLGGDSNGNDLLDVGETWTYEITADDVVLDADETLVNEVTATGVDDEGNEDSDTDTETVTGTDVDPSIHVVKTASVTEIAEGTATDITYTYELTNTGASTDPLSVTGLSDDKLGDILTLGQFTGGDTNGNDLLDTGETWTYEITAEDVVLDADETLVNEVTATGVDDEGNEDSDTDTETVTGTDVDPSIHVVKTASVTEIAEGTPTDITYTYELTNTGASTDPLSVTGLDDDKLGDILANGSFLGGDSNGNDLLDVGETWTYQITADDVVLDADETLVNEVTATGVDDEGNEDSDTDTETVTGTDVDPSIHVVKTASVTEISEGTPTDITYTYELTNTGASTDPLSVTGLDDDKLGDILANGSFLGGDSNGNDLLDVGETWTYEITADDVVLDADETLVNEVTATGVDDEGNEDSDTDTETVTGTDVLPDIKVVKSASVASINEGTATDIVYTYAVTNESTTSTDALDISSLYDDKLGELIGKYESGDTNDDGLLDKGETWIFKATASAVVADVGDSIVNEVTVTATDEEDNEVSDNDTATVTVANVAASIAIAKTVDANGDNVFSELETVQAFGDSVTYRYELTNTGASTDPLTLDDLIDDMGKFADVNLVVNGVVQAGVTIEKSGGDNDALLEVGETWTLKYTTNVNLNPGEKLTNTATVSAVDDEGGTATASDTAAVQALSGPGVRTPGFWTNLGKQFWDGIGNNQTKSGPNFAAGELAYDVDYNNDGVKDGKAGLLIGDYNRNGLTDVGEDTFFISYADALKIIDASAKDQQDTRFVLARDAVATWLNFLAGNPIGDAATDPNSPQRYLNEAIDWLQVTNGGNAGSTWENWGGGSAVKAGGNTIWNNASNTDSSMAGNELSGNTIHSELDFFNNTGMTFLGVNTFVYANDGG